MSLGIAMKRHGLSSDVTSTPMTVDTIRPDGDEEPVPEANHRLGEGREPKPLAKWISPKGISRASRKNEAHPGGAGVAHAVRDDPGTNLRGDLNDTTCWEGA